MRASSISPLAYPPLIDKETAMKIVPNIGTPIRIGYVAAGAALIAAPFVAGMEGSARLVVPTLGALAVAEGLAGW